MAKKLDVVRKGSTGKANGSRMPAVKPKGITARPSQGSAKVQGQPASKMNSAWTLYKKFNY